MKQKNDEIDLLQMLSSLRKHIATILVVAVIGLAAGVVINITSSIHSNVNVEYVVKSSFAVTSQNKDGLFGTNNINPNSTDIKLAESMVDSVIYVIRSDKTLMQVIDRLGLIGITSSQIQNALTLTQYKDTQIIDVKLSWGNAEEGIEILNEIMEVIPRVLIDTLKVGNVTIINEPAYSGNTRQGVNLKLLVLPCMAGVLVVMGIAVLDFLIHPTLLNPDDTQDLFGLDPIGIIPENDIYFDHQQFQKDQSVEDPFAEVIQEAYASTTHILLNRISKKNVNRICFTSSVADEGKTVTAANIAVQLAQLQQKVLLLDLDLRHPNLSGKFLKETRHEHSLNAVYYGEIQAQDAVVHLTEYLDILPTRLEKQRLYLDQTMFRVVESLYDQYDYIIMDTAPVGQVSDVMRLKKLSTEAVFVIRYDYVWSKVIRSNIEKMRNAGFELPGCIVNYVNSAFSNNAYYHHYGKPYYGYGKKKDRIKESDAGDKKQKKSFFHRKKKNEP